MYLYQIRNFIISGLLLLTCSCSVSLTEGYLEKETSTSVVLNNYFSDSSKDYIYKANFEIYKHNLGGLLILKKIDNDRFRFVFTTEFGKKIFDFELIKGAFKTNYILNDLNKKMLINNLQQDLQLLVSENNKVEKAFANNMEMMFEVNYDNHTNYYYQQPKTQQLTKIVQSSKGKVKMIISFDQIENALAKKVELTHKNIKLKIHLNYVGD